MSYITIDPEKIEWSLLDIQQQVKKDQNVFQKIFRLKSHYKVKYSEYPDYSPFPSPRSVIENNPKYELRGSEVRFSESFYNEALEMYKKREEEKRRPKKIPKTRQMFDSITNGNFLKFKELCDNSPHLLNQYIRNDQTALWLSYYHKREDFVKYILSFPNVDIRCTSGGSIISMESDTENIKELVRRGCGANPAVSMAIYRGDRKTLEFLMSHHTFRVSFGDIKKGNGRCSFLHMCLTQGLNDVAKKMIEMGANVNVGSESLNYYETDLYVATKNGDVEMVKLLLSKGADKTKGFMDCMSERADSINYSPLSVAKNEETRRLLQ